jgi:hypothetical protein
MAMRLEGELVVATDGDSFVRDGWPSAKFGAGAAIEVKQFQPTFSRTAFVRFPTSSFEGTATRATLRAYGYFGQVPVVVAAFGTSADWSEGDLTIAHQPDVSGSALSSVTVGSAAPRWYEWDVTAWVQAEKAVGKPAVAFALKSLTYGNGIAYFASKESGSSAAQLVVSGASLNPPPTVAIAARALPEPVNGTTAALSVLGADNGGESNLRYTWSSAATNERLVTFSENGTNAAKNTTASVRGTGTFTLFVDITDANGATVRDRVTFDVVQSPASLLLAPLDRTIRPGEHLQFLMNILDQFGYTMRDFPPSTWSVSGGGTIDSSGLFTSLPTARGLFTVTLSAAGLSESTTVKLFAGSQVTSLAPRAITSVRDGVFANVPFPTANAFYVKNGLPDYSRHTFLSFDLASVPGTITGATLRFVANSSGGSAVPVQVRDVADTAWSASTMTWNNQPPAVPSPVAWFETTPALPGQSPYAIDLSSYVKAKQAEGRDRFSIQLAMDAFSPTALAIISNDPEIDPRLDVQSDL